VPQRRQFAAGSPLMAWTPTRSVSSPPGRAWAWKTGLPTRAPADDKIRTRAFGIVDVEDHLRSGGAVTEQHRADEFAVFIGVQPVESHIVVASHAFSPRLGPAWASGSEGDSTVPKERAFHQCAQEHSA